jgi:hypothetical protein
VAELSAALGSDPFWIEHAHDRSSASDGLSRYGAYVRQRITGGFAGCWDGTYETRLAERFAALAWDTATGPVMAPPYADWRSPVLSARAGIDYEGGSEGLIATVEIAAGWPPGLHEARGRAGGRSWHSWKRERSCGQEYLRAPYDDEVARGGCYALTTVRLVFPVPASLLPDAPGAGHRPGEVEETARRAVAALAGYLNLVTGPAIEALEQQGAGHG